MNLKNLTVGKRITAGFSVILLLFACVVGIAIINANKVSTTMALSGKAAQLDGYVMNARKYEKEYVINKDGRSIKGLDKNVAGVAKLLEDLREGTADGVLLSDISQVKTLIKGYHTGFKKLVENNVKGDAEKAKMERASVNLLVALNDKIRKQVDIKQSMNFVTGQTLNPIYLEIANLAGLIAMEFMECRLNETAFILNNDESYTQKVHDKLKSCDKTKGELSTTVRISKDNEMAEAYGIVQTELTAYGKSFDNLVSLWKNNNQISARMLGDGDKAIEIGNKIKQNAEEGMVSAKDSLIRLSMILLAAGIIAGILLAFFIVRSIAKALNRIIAHLTEGADQVAAASGQVASASQQLAEGAGEQASSLEETSSSLEELASMTKQNADNAQEADALSKEAGRVVEEVNEKLARMSEAVDDIGKNSEETQKIIKTIDEIAFQTNLLALNAAVEAARAGEAGAGFAVVAEEVRNLALRSAEAAKNTSDLIGKTVISAREGDRLNKETNNAFKKNVEIVGKTSDLVSEIAAASGEQSQGINQINMAMSEMDKVTQSNAANAEESASASEEMSAQAEGMKGVVADLIALVGGNNNSGRAAGQQGDGMMSVDRTRKPSGDPREEEPLAIPAHMVAKGVKPEEGDFKDF